MLDELGGEEGVGLAGRQLATVNFRALGHLAECEYIIEGNADFSRLHELDASVTEHHVLTATVVVDAVEK